MYSCTWESDLFDPHNLDTHSQIHDVVWQRKSSASSRKLSTTVELTPEMEDRLQKLAKLEEMEQKLKVHSSLCPDDILCRSE